MSEKESYDELLARERELLQSLQCYRAVTAGLVLLIISCAAVLTGLYMANGVGLCYNRPIAVTMVNIHLQYNYIGRSLSILYNHADSSERFYV